MPHYVLTGPCHFWLSPCPWMANNRQQSQFWTYRLFKRRSGQTSHVYPYEKLLVKSAGQRSPIFEPRVVTYHFITVILHSSGFRWRAGYMGISPQYGQMENSHNISMYNIYLDILGKTDFSEFQTQGVTIHVTGSFPQKTLQFEFDYFLLTMITLQSVTDTARQTFDCFFLH